MRKLKGVTLIEMLIVMVLIGIVTAISLPKLANTTDDLAVRSARQEVGSYLSQARALAIQNGRMGRFIRSGNTIRIALDNASGQTIVLASQDLGVGNGVTLVASPSDTVAFDPRGVLTTDASASSPKVLISRNGIADSVCVVGRGKVSISQCQLAQ